MREGREIDRECTTSEAVSVLIYLLPSSSSPVRLQLVLQEEKRKRAKVNRRMMHAFRQGAKVKAIYEDEDNDPAVSPTTLVRHC